MNGLHHWTEEEINRAVMESSLVAIRECCCDGRELKRGKVIGYQANPTFLVETEDGERFHWVAVGCVPVSGED